MHSWSREDAYIQIFSDYNQAEDDLRGFALNFSLNFSNLNCTVFSLLKWDSFSSYKKKLIKEINIIFQQFWLKHKNKSDEKKNPNKLDGSLQKECYEACIGKEHTCRLIFHRILCSHV